MKTHELLVPAQIITLSLRYNKKIMLYQVDAVSLQRSFYLITSSTTVPYYSHQYLFNISKDEQYQRSLIK